MASLGGRTAPPPDSPAHPPPSCVGIRDARPPAQAGEGAGRHPETRTRRDPDWPLAPAGTCASPACGNTETCWEPLGQEKSHQVWWGDKEAWGRDGCWKRGAAEVPGMAGLFCGLIYRDSGAPDVELIIRASRSFH